jgi:hypothetical protein
MPRCRYQPIAISIVVAAAAAGVCIIFNIGAQPQHVDLAELEIELSLAWVFVVAIG